MALAGIPALIQPTVNLLEVAPSLHGKFHQLSDRTAFPRCLSKESTLRIFDTNSIGSNSFQERGGEFLTPAIASAGTVLNAAAFVCDVPVVAVYLLPGPGTDGWPHRPV